MGSGADPSNRLSDVSEKPKRKKRRSTSHLKAVPQVLAEREAFKSAAEEYVKSLDMSRPFTKNELEGYARDLLARLEQPEKYLGFAMVMIGNFYWKRQLIAIPFERRMLLLPHCLKHAEGCPAEYDEFGLDCERCGACSIADYKVRAEQLGYKVLVAEGSPIVLKIIVEGYIDGIVGVACLNVLEKAIDKVLIAGVPSYAVPLHSGDCKNTSLDEAWIWDVLETYEPLKEPATASYVPVMRAASNLFEEQFDEVLPATRKAGSVSAQIAMTEQISRDWLANGGKRFRPFITLATYAAFQEATEQTDLQAFEFPLGVRRVAMAIEAFHKASLVHDDIEDGDLYRYGRETLHRLHDVGTAINVGDHLIGVGYQLLTSASVDSDPAAVCEITGQMAQAHLRLCDGQGAEMAWKPGNLQNLKPLDALQIYALKTSPAFEAALFAGVRLATDVEPYREMISAFTRHVGVGFQILNDLKDWQGDDNNKLVAGQDGETLRPTVLLALALDAAEGADRSRLMSLIQEETNPKVRSAELKRIFTRLGLFAKAEALVEKSRNRAEALADEVEPDEFRRLLYFFIDTMLAEEGEPTPLEQQQGQALIPLQIAGG